MNEGKARCRYCGALLSFVGAAHERNCRSNDGSLDKLNRVDASKCAPVSKAGAGRTESPNRAEVVKAVEPKLPPAKPNKAESNRAGPNRIEPTSRKVSAKAVESKRAEPAASVKEKISPAERTRRWREANRERSRVSARNYMRRYRARSAEERDRAKYQELKARFEGKAKTDSPS